MVEPPGSSHPDLPAGWDTLPEPARPAILALWQQNQALADEVAHLRSELEQVRRSTIPWKWISHPLVVLTASLGATLAFAAFVIIDNGLGVSPDQHTFFLFYMVPITAPFVAYLLDRFAQLHELRPLQWAADFSVIVLGLLRALYPLPGISGHALFLTYALLTTRSRVTKILAMLVLAEVIYIKIFVWHDPTLFGGVLVATIAAVLFYLAGRTRNTRLL